jgi:sorting nexin-29
VEAATEKLKNNKAPGMNFIKAKLVKHAGVEYTKYLHQLIVKIWINEIIPEEWNLGIICPTHKKGDAMTCSNYRGISLLCTTYKMFSNILFKRLDPYVEDVISDYQYGFCQGRSTSNQIFNLRQVLEKCNKFGTEIHHLFMHFRAAYDSIGRSNLYTAMKEYQIPRKLTALVKTTKSNSLCQIRIHNLLSDPIHIKNGVRQGDALACLLFNIALEKVIRD